MLTVFLMRLIKVFMTLCYFKDLICVANAVFAAYVPYQSVNGWNVYY